jgi:hypothetical protein
MRRTATARSSSVKPRELCGKSGRMKIADMAITIVAAPSIQYNHLQARWPSVPSMLPRTAAPTSDENAFEIRLPQNKMAFRSVSSRLVYHLDKMSSAPGRKAASTKPIKKRMATIPAKFDTFPDSVEIMPHISITMAIYNEGLGIRLMIMFDGTCCATVSKSLVDFSRYILPSRCTRHTLYCR